MKYVILTLLLISSCGENIIPRESVCELYKKTPTLFLEYSSFEVIGKSVLKGMIFSLRYKGLSGPHFGFSQTGMIGNKEALCTSIDTAKEYQKFGNVTFLYEPNEVIAFGRIDEDQLELTQLGGKENTPLYCSNQITGAFYNSEKECRKEGGCSCHYFCIPFTLYSSYTFNCKTGVMTLRNVEVAIGNKETKMEHNVEIKWIGISGEYFNK